MVDLGLYNFVKNALGQGKTKEEITGTLLQNGWKQESINEALDDVTHNRPPTVQPSPNYGPTDDAAVFVKTTVRPTLITVFCGYYLITWILQLISYVVFTLSVMSTSAAVAAPDITASSIPGLLLLLGTFVGIVGYWDMKKWGVVIYTLTNCLAIVYIFGTVNTTVTATLLDSLLVGFVTSWIVPLFVIGVGFKYWSKMR